jgi:hypothetical protein
MVAAKTFSIHADVADGDSVAGPPCTVSSVAIFRHTAS